MAVADLEEILDGREGCNVDTLEGICEAFDITLGEFFTSPDDKIIPIIVSSREQEIIDIYRSLSTDRQDALYTILYSIETD